MEIHQECPNEVRWRLWRRAMKLWTQTRTLHQPLGQWIVSGSRLHHTWLAYYEYSNGCLYTKQCDKYVRYSPDKENIHLFLNGVDSDWFPTKSSVPAHTHTTNGMITIKEVDCSGVVGDVQ
eukprot:2523433-Ditylum_brightwellii.AAC.1